MVCAFLVGYGLMFFEGRLSDIGAFVCICVLTMAII